MTLPESPHTRLESYLARLAGQEVEVPENPVSRIECYLAYLCENGGAMGNGAGPHNGIFRGKDLGDELTAEQFAAIQDGSFKDMYIGDYWTIGEVVYRIAGFDTFLTVGPPEHRVTDHHAVIVPDDYMGTSVYASSASDLSGGYLNSALKTTGLSPILAQVKSAFGADHIMAHYTMLSNTAPSGGGIPTAAEWVESEIDVLSLVQVMGYLFYSYSGKSVFNIGDRCTRLPLFTLGGSKYIGTTTRTMGYWLQDIIGYNDCAAISNYAINSSATSESTRGIRPYFLLG